MPAIIDSAPDCITNVAGAKPADDSADFIIQAAYEKCAGFMTFGPGSTYGEDGAGARGAYYVVTWIGIAVMVARARLLGRMRRTAGSHWTLPTPDRRRHGRRRGDDDPPSDSEAAMDDPKRQIEFPPLQTHSRGSSS